jgi:Ca2+-binding EF-hand superfamily protein
LAFNFANKINASRGFESAKSSGGGKSPTRRAFEAVDVNGDRRIDREELQIAVQRMGFQVLDNGVIDEFFAFLSGGNASFIDYVSFCNAIDRVPSNIRACW